MEANIKDNLEFNVLKNNHIKTLAKYKIKNDHIEYDTDSYEILKNKLIDDKSKLLYFKKVILGVKDVSEYLLDENKIDTEYIYLDEYDDIKIVYKIDKNNEDIKNIKENIYLNIIEYFSFSEELKEKFLIALKNKNIIDTIDHEISILNKNELKNKKEEDNKMQNISVNYYLILALIIISVLYIVRYSYDKTLWTLIIGAVSAATIKVIEIIKKVKSHRDEEILDDKTVVINRGGYLKKKLSNVRIDINDSIFNVGSNKSNSLVINKKTVSKEHAVIIRRNGLCYIKDKKSKNGTFINENKLLSNEEYELKSGDEISFGDASYIYV